jgi:hypothetical protein
MFSWQVHIFCLSTLKSWFFFFLQLDSLLLVLLFVHKTLIFVLNFPIIITFIKKALQIFCVTKECDIDF